MSHTDTSGESTVPNRPLVYVVVLSYNGRKWLRRCLESVLRTDYPNFQVLVVDNGSSDGGVEFVRSAFPGVGILENGTNLGFAGGCNVGIQAAIQSGAEYVALVNQDVIVEEGWLQPLVEVCQRYQDVAVVSPIQLDYGGNYLDENFARLLGGSPEFLRDLWRGSLADVYFFPFVIGAAMLVSRRALMRVGRLDETFFCYGEEADFCQRALYHGFQVAVCTRASVRHWHSLLHNRGSRRIRAWRARADMVLALKNPWHPFLVNVANCVWLTVRRIGISLVRREYSNLWICLGAAGWLALRIHKVFVTRFKELTEGRALGS